MAKTKKRGTKSPAKKKARGKRAEKKEGTFSEMLEELIEEELISYEDFRDELHDMLLRVTSPKNNSAVLMLNTAASRMQGFNNDIFQPAYDEKRMFPWILPPVASAWFEGILESCIMVWLQAGKPPRGQRLVPHVRTYVRSQAAIFTMMTGGQLAD